MKSLSETIKESRNKLGISQRELAKRIGVDDSYIAKIESGITKKPSVINLVKLGTELNLRIVELCQKSGYSGKEINELFNLNSSDFRFLSDFDIIEENEIKDYVFYDDEFECKFIDIVEVLKNYKKGKIDETTAVSLIYSCQKVYTNDGKAIYPSQSGNIELDFPKY
ncbi:MAG: helix-turn-helix transcriptional regulator [Firmicutes bacterium]|nr:helix-turn-helix transcriptional regulator [Bacillota bacterium]